MRVADLKTPVSNAAMACYDSHELEVMRVKTRLSTLVGLLHLARRLFRSWLHYFRSYLSQVSGTLRP